MFNKSFLITTLIILCCGCSLFRKTKPVFLEADYNKAKEYARFITKEELFNNLSVLSADSLEGRETTKPGQKKAADFIRNFFISNNIPFHRSQKPSIFKNLVLVFLTLKEPL